MSDWFSMDDTFECANCGREGDRYTLEQAMRRCGTGYGEWYCVEGEGCNKKEKVTQHSTEFELNSIPTK